MSVATLQLPTRPTDRDAARDVLSASCGGETVELHAARALYWPRGRTLFVADVHLGKGAAFRAGGIPVPRGATANDLARLATLVARTRAGTLCVLGDFLHAATGRVPALDTAFRAWRDAHAGLSVRIVRGNHDARAGDPPAAWAVDVVDEPHALPPFLACHVPQAPRTGYALCGHVHPGVRLAGRGRESVRLPCFVLGRRRALLPAFGRLTGLAIVAAIARGHGRRHRRRPSVPPAARASVEQFHAGCGVVYRPGNMDKHGRRRRYAAVAGFSTATTRARTPILAALRRRKSLLRNGREREARPPAWPLWRSR